LNAVCNADRDPWPVVYNNALTALTEAEMTRRVVLFSDINSAFRFPGVTWEDAKNILYGAESSVLFPGLKWGGMSADIGIFMQSALQMSEVEEKSKGSWRIFSKLGAGWSDTRSAGEIVSNAYACLPALDDSGNAIANSGYEITITVRNSVPGDGSLKYAEQNVLKTFQEIIGAVISERIS
jgi:hypothetical protein